MTLATTVAVVAAVLPGCVAGWMSPQSMGRPPVQQRRCPNPLAGARAPTPVSPEDQRQQSEPGGHSGPKSVSGALESLLPGYVANGVASEPARGGGTNAQQPLSGSLQALRSTGDTAALQRREELMAESYEACRVITKQYAKTFYFGTKFFDEEKRRAVWAVYAWCRRTDDIVDKPRKEMNSLRSELAEWGRRTEEVWSGRAHDLIDLALVDTIQKYPDLSVKPFEDMIKGMVMDLDQNRFETFEELYVYCYRVAGTVGLMMMPIMGTAPDATFEEALEPALALGVALQLTNILRDVGEDRVRQRIYLPQEDLRRFGVTEASLLKGVKDEKYVALLKFQIARARDWYKRAEDGIPLLAKDAQLPIRASLDMYSTILDKIESNDYDNFNKRAYTAKWEKLAMRPRAYLRVAAPDLGL